MIGEIAANKGHINHNAAYSKAKRNKADDPVRVIGQYDNFWLVDTGKDPRGGKKWMFVLKGDVEEYVEPLTIVWPCDLHYVNPSSDSQGAWGWRKFDGKAIEFHRGVDIRDGSGSAEGKSVKAVAGGTVRVPEYDASGFGYHIIVEHDIPGKGKYNTLYAHMQEGSLAANGSIVDAGATIGKIGNTGNTSKKWNEDLKQYIGGHHLHFEFWRGTRDDRRNSVINPTNLYAHRDTRTTSTNPQPLFKKTGSTYAYNPSFDWNYSDNPLPTRYSHSTAYQN